MNRCRIMELLNCGELHRQMISECPQLSFRPPVDIDDITYNGYVYPWNLDHAMEAKMHLNKLDEIRRTYVQGEIDTTIQRSKLITVAPKLNDEIGLMQTSKLVSANMFPQNSGQQNNIPMFSLQQQQPSQFQPQLLPPVQHPLMNFSNVFQGQINNNNNFNPLLPRINTMQPNATQTNTTQNPLNNVPMFLPQQALQPPIFNNANPPPQNTNTGLGGFDMNLFVQMMSNNKQANK